MTFVMSFSIKEERPKLKAKRFNKFETSSSAAKTEKDDTGSTENITRRGVKRVGAEYDYDSVKRKQVRTTCSSISPSPVKNLANNRLKKLKEQIKNSLNAEENTEKNKGKFPTKPIFCLNDNECKKNVSTNFIKSNTLDNRNITVSSSSHLKKNLAEERLHNLKKKINAQDSRLDSKLSDKGKVCDSTLEIPQSSTSKNKEDKQVLKRNRCKITSTCDYDDQKHKFKRKSSPLNTENPTTSEIEDNISLKEIKIQKNKCTLQQSKEVEGLNPRSVLQKLSDIKTDIILEQPITQRLDVDITQGNSSNLTVTSQNNFLNKPNMMECLIKSDQDQSNFHTNIEKGDNCLKETIDPNRDTKPKDESEDMEWTNSEPDEESVVLNRNVNEPSEKDKVIKDPEKIKDVCIVVDTNVFIWGLSKLRDIVNLKITGSCKPIIFVPWMVIQELDYMKDSSSDAKLLKNVVNAVKFVNNALQNNSPQLVGQTVFDVDKQKYVGASPDDKIIACCFQAAEKYETVMLLSNDVNLKNKAMINNISSCSTNDIMIKLMSKLVKNNKYQKIMHKMGIMCSSIICECMKEAYGDIWSRMDMMNCPPWSLAECLKRFKKYWTSVFREKLMKQFTKALQDLQHVIETNRYITDDSEEFVEFMKLCVSLCIFLKDIDECRGFIENTLADIAKIA